MISGRKNYLIEQFFKKCTIQNFNEAYFEFYFKSFENTYNISKEKSKKLKEIYNTEEYTRRIFPIIDKYFTEEELQEAIKFYSSESGKKMLNMTTLDEIGQVAKNIFAEIEQEFIIANNKNE